MTFLAPLTVLQYFWQASASGKCGTIVPIFWSGMQKPVLQVPYPPRLRGSRYCCPLHSRWPRSPALGKGWSTGCHFWKQFGKSSQVFSKHTNNHVTSGICLMTSKFIALQTQLCTHGTKCLSVTTKLPGYWLLHLPNMWDAEFLGWHPSPHELKIYLIN